jgi:3-deoxy-D-manno-octulosonate 8-phosphate phosphatase KdsC-like HAD superfamily phosphatase
MERLKEKCKDIKIIVSAVDGIITDGRAPIDELQNVPFKNYCMKDFEVINEIKKTFKFIFMASDNSISYNLFRARNIPFYWAPGTGGHYKTKVKVLAEIMHKHNVKPDNVMYIGCSYSDVECMYLAEISFCTKDAPHTVSSSADYELPASAGENVLCELYEVLRHIIK